MTNVEELVEAAADSLRKCAFATDENKTLHLRAVANRFVDIREVCEDPFERGADYTGRSKPYRDAVSQTYRLVEDEVPPNRLRQMKSQVRYHVSSIVRERLADQPDALELYGLQTKSVKERSLDRIKQHRAMVDAGVVEAATEESNATARLVHGARYLMELATEEGTVEANREAKDYIRQGLQQLVDTFPELAPPVDRIELARNLLGAVPPESLRHTVQQTRERADELLTETAETAHTLRRETTTASDTIDMLDELLEKYRDQREEGREAG